MGKRLINSYYHKPTFKALKLTILSLTVSIFIFTLKLLAYFITNSVAIYSDAIESIVNIISATMALLGIKVALKPPDEEHPYGHTKFEYLISISEAFLIIGASFSIFWKAYQSFLSPKPLESIQIGSFLVFITIFLNSFLSYILYKGGKRENSPILISHAFHLFTDVLSTLGIVTGVLIAQLIKIFILDPLIAFIIGIYILYLGGKIIKGSTIALLDVNLPSDQIKSIQDIINDTIKNYKYKDYKIYDAHDFKSRRAGRKGFVEFNLTVSGKMSVKEAHDLCNELEKKITNKFPELTVTIHVEPEKEENN